jgi:hypothetical protein
MDLFTIDERENLIVNKQDVLVYKEFVSLYKTDLTPTKRHFVAVLKYLFFRYCPRAFPFQKGMTAKEANEYALKHSGLDKNFLGTPEYKAVEKIYVETTQDATDELIKASLNLLRNSHNLINMLLQQLEELLADTAKPNLGEYLQWLDNVNKASKSIPDYIQNFEKLMEIKKKDTKNKRKIRGGEEWKPSMDGVGFGDESDGNSKPERIG